MAASAEIIPENIPAVAAGVLSSHFNRHFFWFLTNVVNMAGPIQIGDIIKFSEIALQVWSYGWEAEHNAG